MRLAVAVLSPGSGYGLLKQELVEVQLQFEKERADLEQVEMELAELKQNSTAARELPEAAGLLNQLKAKRKKSGVTLSDVEMLLELLES